MNSFTLLYNRPDRTAGTKPVKIGSDGVVQRALEPDGGVVLFQA